jgi:hypothetical protein
MFIDAYLCMCINCTFFTFINFCAFLGSLIVAVGGGILERGGDFVATVEVVCIGGNSVYVHIFNQPITYMCK